MLAEENINYFFEETKRDTDKKHHEKLDKYKNKCIEFNKLCPEYSLDYIIKRRNKLPMIMKFSGQEFGCSECRCVHKIPYVSSEMLTIELKILTNHKFLDSNTRRGLIGMLRVGEYKKIIPIEVVKKWTKILQVPSYKYIPMKKRQEIHNYLIEVAKKCDDPRYILTNEYIKSLRERIDGIEGTSCGHDFTFFVKVGCMDQVIKEINKIKEIKLEWFQFKPFTSGYATYY